MSSTADSQFCTSCGSPVVAGDSFCARCGTTVRKPAPETTSEAADATANAAERTTEPGPAEEMGPAPTVADRIGRGLAYVAATTLTGLVIFGQGATTGEILSMVGGLLASAILGFAPAVQEMFNAPGAPQHDQPTSIVVARVSVIIWVILVGTAAVLDFCLGQFEGKYIAYGLILASVAVGGYVLFKQLALPNRQPRTWVTAGTGLAILFLLIGRHDTGFALIVGMTAAIPACLWLPNDARAFYGEAPLTITVSQGQ